MGIEVMGVGCFPAGGRGACQLPAFLRMGPKRKVGGFCGGGLLFFGAELAWF